MLWPFSLQRCSCLSHSDIPFYRPSHKNVICPPFRKPTRNPHLHSPSFQTKLHLCSPLGKGAPRSLSSSDHFPHEDGWQFVATLRHGCCIATLSNVLRWQWLKGHIMTRILTGRPTMTPVRLRIKALGVTRAVLRVKCGIKCVHESLVLLL